MTTVPTTVSAWTPEQLVSWLPRAALHEAGHFVAQYLVGGKPVSAYIVTVPLWAGTAAAWVFEDRVSTDAVHASESRASVETLSVEREYELSISRRQ